MQCRQCGTEIADKALICYKGGAAPPEPVFKPAPLGRTSSPARTAASVLALVLLVLLALYMGRISTGEAPRYVGWVAVVIALVVVALRTRARRR